MVKNFGQLELYHRPKTAYEIIRERKEKKENILNEIIDSILKKDPSKEIMLGGLTLEYNLHVADTGLKIDVNNNEDLEIIRKVLNEKGLKESTKDIYKMIMADKERKERQRIGEEKLLEERPIKQWNSIEKSLPKEKD